MKRYLNVGAGLLLTLHLLCVATALHAQSEFGIADWSSRRPIPPPDSNQIHDTKRILFVTFAAGNVPVRTMDAKGHALTGFSDVDSIGVELGCIAILKRFTGKTPNFDYDQEQSYILRFREDIEVEAARDRYVKTGRFQSVSLNKLIVVRGGWATHIPNDPRFDLQWALKNDSVSIQSFYPGASVRLGADMNMEQGWDCEQGDSTVIAAIIDTGCKTDHTELASRLWINPGEIDGDSIDNDGNGHIDDIHGWDFRQDDNTLEDIDPDAHGTGISGIIGAESGNNFSVTGIDLNCKLMIVKFTNAREATITPADLDSAFHYAVDNGADVINFAYNIENDSRIRDAMLYAHRNGVVVVTITGNDNIDADSIYPGAFPDSLGLLVVGATGPDDYRCTTYTGNPGVGSNHTTNIDVTAPGDYILVLDNQGNNHLSTVGGTSAACAYVTGLATLLKAQNPGLSADSIASIIKSTADDQVGDPVEDTPGFDRYHGYGRINAERALCGANSIAEIETNQFFLSVFPNPSSGRISATISNLTVKTAKVRLYDIHGRLALAHEFKGGQQIAFDLPHANGLYMVEVVVNDRLRSVAKVLRVD